MVTETDEPLDVKSGHVNTANRRINPNLVLLKVSLFFMFGATSSLIPYLTVHMQSLGLTVAEIATVYLILLVTTCLSPPITGYLVDRFGRYKPVLLTALVLNIVFHHALDQFVPRRPTMELRTVTAKEYEGQFGIKFEGPSCLNLCPDLADQENAFIQFCSPGGNETSQIELDFYNAISNTYTPCGLLTLKNCTLKPIIQNHMNVECRITQPTEYDRTFWYYLLIRFFAVTMLTAMLTITDPIAMAMIEQYGGDYGRERLFSSAGMAFFTPLTGLLMDYFSSGTDGDTNYLPAFCAYDVLLGLSLIASIFLPVDHKQPTESVMKHLFKILRLPHVVIFIFFLFFLGGFWGFIESYLFVIMKEMGSPNYLLGLTYTVGTVASIPMMYLTGPITRWAGHVNLLVVAFLAHAVRILGYSFIENPFWCFPIEVNEAISCYFMWAVVTTYCAVLAPNNVVATLIGVSGMVHYCLGKGVGSFAGGYLIAEYGTRMGFRYTGCIALACGCCYKLLHLVWLKMYDKPNKNVTEDDQNALQIMLEKRVSLVPKGEQTGNLIEKA